MSTIDEITKEIKKAKDIIILTHNNPDGDAIGSSLAVYTVLKEMGKDVEVVIPELPRLFKFLPNAEEVRKEGSKKVYDLAISLDCATIKQLNGWKGYFEDAKERIVIDHHSTNDMYGDINYVDLSAPACSQVLYTLLKYAGIEISQEVGTCLMTGMITDTGGFQYSGVSKETFEIAANLLTSGVNISKIYKRVFSTHTKGNFELKKLAMNRMEILEDGKVSFTYITKKDEENVSAEPGDYEGIVDEGRNLEGVEVAIFLHEIKEGEGFKVSTRANEYVNVSDVCLMFGGGGHPRAAGASMQGTIEQIKEKLLKEIRLQLK